LEALALHDLASKAFRTSRQAVNKHVRRLVEQNALLVRGSARAPHYALHPLVKWEHIYTLAPMLDEFEVWRRDVAPLSAPLPDNVMDIWSYGFTEMLNNAIDHSSGQNVSIQWR
jgi:hypothetical protein